MIEAKKAAFNFVNYEVSEFVYKQPTNNNVDAFSIGFNPSGIFNRKKSEFIVILGFNATYEDKDIKDVNEALKVTLKAKFSFDHGSSLNDVPEYFYRNALAIIYPYLRAFVSTMTFQANLKPPMLLPILNLSEIEKPFRENIKEID